MAATLQQSTSWGAPSSRSRLAETGGVVVGGRSTVLGTELSADGPAPCIARLRESQSLGHDGQFGCDKCGDGGLPGMQCGIHLTTGMQLKERRRPWLLSVNSSSPC